MLIDLRSDTLTLPNKNMQQCLLNLPLGDDSYGEDSSVRLLEEFAADLFAKEAALFMPTGTMSNQVSLKVYTRPGDEVITDASYHINFFESAQTSALTGVTLNLTNCGKIDVEKLKQAVAKKFRADLYAKSRLLFLENTINCMAGAFYYPRESFVLADYARTELKMPTHIDGARILNACVAADCSPSHFGSADSLSLCLAKGLGAPFGSLLMGSKEFIAQAKIYRKWFGGCLHQSGMMAMAAYLCLKDDWRETMASDHENAKKIASALASFFPTENIHYGGTNIVMVTMSNEKEAEEKVIKLAERGIRALRWNEGQIRFVTHKDVSKQAIAKAINIIPEVLSE